nr:helical backbone metal receptor [Alkalilimnicola ehrlichii]
MLALRPDLVVAWHSGNGTRTVQRLQDLGLTVYQTEPHDLDDIADAIERLGVLAGTEAIANAAAEEFRTTKADLTERYSERPKVGTFYQIWNKPLMTINGEHLISEVIELCGGYNVFADLGPLAASIDTEAVLQTQPEVIIASGMGEERPEWLEDWRRWQHLDAVKADNLFFIPPSIIQRHSPRILQGAAMMCEHLETARERRES